MKERNNVKHVGPPGMGVTEKPKDMKKTISKLMKYISNYKKGIIIAICFTICSTIFSIIGPKILGNATTEVFNGLISKVNGGTGINFSKIGYILLTLLFLYLISAIFGYIQGIIMTNISQKTAYNLRKDVVSKINKMPFGYFDHKTHGETLSLITNDIDNISSSLNQSLTQLISSIITMIGVFIMMLSINVVMALITFILVPISLFIVSKIVKKSQHHFKNQQDYLASVNGNIEEMFSGQSVIKAFNNEENMLNNFKEENDKLYESSWKSQFLSGIMPPCMQFVGNLGYVMVSVLGGYYALIGRISIGDIQSFIQYSRNFTQPINQIAQIVNMLQSMMASSERVFNFLDEEEMAEVKPLKLKDDIKGKVEFKNIKFGYNSDELIIKDFSIKVKPGQKIAIVGPTGAGKTTLVKLLMKFYQVNEGKILIDDIDINDFSRSNLEGVMGMVLQDTWLFSGTIKDNIRYGKLDATDEEIEKAAKMAYIDHYIRTLPEGYNMILNEETSNISGGQKQLLTIARAILSNPKILILDEATSSVDTRTEVLIQKAMDKLMKGRTSFIIAHRLSTIKNADTILVLNNGDIVEQGTHDELLKKKGFYANLYNSQFEDI